MKKKFEIWLLKIAVKILVNHNVSRSPYVSRKDNNALWGMAERIEVIIERMERNYTGWYWDHQDYRYKREMKP